jgi:hypothetical protein
MRVKLRHLLAAGIFISLSLGAQRHRYKSRLYKLRCFNGYFCVHVSANLAFWGFHPGDLYMETQPEAVLMFKRDLYREILADRGWNGAG